MSPFCFGPAGGNSSVSHLPLSPSFPHSTLYYILTATLRAARDGTLSSVEWRYRSTVALAASTAVGVSEAMPTTASSAASAANRETILSFFFAGGQSNKTAAPKAPIKLCVFARK